MAVGDALRVHDDCLLAMGQWDGTGDRWILFGSCSLVACLLRALGSGGSGSTLGLGVVYFGYLISLMLGSFCVVLSL